MFRERCRLKREGVFYAPPMQSQRFLVKKFQRDEMAYFTDKATGLDWFRNDNGHPRVPVAQG